MSNTKLGAHVIRSAANLGDYLSAKPAVAKFVGDWGMAADVPVGALIIGRKHQGNYDAQHQYNSGLSPEDAASRFVQDQLATYQSNPHITYWEGHNEPVWNTHTEMRWYAHFEIERMVLMKEMGLKCVIGNFATGTPDLSLWSTFSLACQIGQDFEAILGLHEYSCPWMWWMTGAYQVDPGEDEGDEGWTTLRYRKIYRQYLIPDDAVIPLAITECGIDPLVSPLPDGCDGGTWKQLGDYWRETNGEHNKADYYYRQLMWYDRELQKDDYVAGATIFCWGNYGSPWSDFDVAGTDVATKLVAYTQANPAKDFEYVTKNGDSGDGRPRVQYERTYVLMPPNADASLASIIVEETWDRERWTVGGSADDAGIGDLDVRRAIAIKPDQWSGDLAAFFEEHYPGVVYWPLYYDNRYQLDGRLLAYGLKECGFSLVYPVSHGTDREPYITDDFGPWRETYYHNGLDLRASWAVWGDEVFSATDGTVVRAGYYTDESWFGYQVRVRTNAPDGREVLVRYAHLVAGGIYVNTGDTVTAGQKLGKPNSTGSSSADHLHIDLKIGSQYADPELLMDWSAPNPEPENKRGVHAAPIPSPPAGQQFWLAELKAMNIAWYKALVTGGQDMKAWLITLLQNDITPIVRLYMGSQFPGRLNAQLMDFADALIAEGITLFEIGNEPNLTGEWQEIYQDQVDWHNTDLVNQVAEAWYQDAMEIIAAGGRPAFYAMAPTDRNGINSKYSGPMWATYMMDYLASHHYNDVAGAFRDGHIWIATHTSPFSRALDFSPSHTGHHFDDMCMRGYEYYRDLAKSFFSVDPLVISTEGGAYSPEHLADLGWGTYTEEHWAQLTTDVYDWIKGSGLSALCTWILTDEDVGDTRWHDNGWYHGRDPRLPAQALKTHP